MVINFVQEGYITIIAQIQVRKMTWIHHTYYSIMYYLRMGPGV